MFKIKIIFFLLFFIKGYFKRIILSLNKISFEKYYGTKVIDEFINYDIYTNLLVGTPPQKVTHFIEPNDSIFQFKKLSFQYNIRKFNTSIISKIE